MMASSVLLITPGVASADPIPGTRCDWPVKSESHIINADVTPVVTHFLAFNIATGSSGDRTDTLTVTNTVTTTYNFSAEISQTISLLMVQIGQKVGFSVQTTTSSTTTESSTMHWSFSQPGYYGLYKGTRRVDGLFRTWYCKPGIPGIKGKWSQPVLEPYTTYTYMEEGVVVCSDVYPWGTVRAAAQEQLDC